MPKYVRREESSLQHKVDAWKNNSRNLYFGATASDVTEMLFIVQSKWDLIITNV